VNLKISSNKNKDRRLTIQENPQHRISVKRAPRNDSKQVPKLQQVIIDQNQAKQQKNIALIQMVISQMSEQ